MLDQLVLAVPNRNGATYLAQTLESLNANGDCVRWWFQDGASTDSSVEIARSLARPGDTVISEADAGQADALNRAISKMGGNIIGFINSDDLIDPGAAALVLEAFAKNPEIDLVVGQLDWIDSKGQVTGHHAGDIASLSQLLDLQRVWWRNHQWVQPEVYWRRTLWEKVGSFDTRYHLAFDYDFWVRCLRAGAHVGFIAKSLDRFRLHDAQKSRASAQAANELRDIVSKNLADPQLSLSALRRWNLKAWLSYDRYQSGQDYPAGSRPSFASMLLRHPEWLVVQPVRDRLLARLFGGGKK